MFLFLCIPLLLRGRGDWAPQATAFTLIPFTTAMILCTSAWGPSFHRGPDQFLAFCDEFGRFGRLPVVDATRNEVPIAEKTVAGLHPGSKRHVAFLKILVCGQQLQVTTFDGSAWYPHGDAAMPRKRRGLVALAWCADP